MSQPPIDSLLADNRLLPDKLRADYRTGSTEQTYWGYLDNDSLLYQQLPNGVRTTYTLNPRGLLTDLVTRTNAGSGTLLSEFGSTSPSGQMLYDSVGNRVSMNASIPLAPSYSGLTTYAYDTKNQLGREVSARFPGYDRSWVFDPAGNPMTVRNNGPIVYDSQNRVDQTVTPGYQFDHNGNPTLYQSVPMAFDPENHLTQIGVSGSPTFTAGYTGDGLRDWKQTNANGRTYFVYDGATPLVEVDVNGVVQAVNTFGAAGLLSRRTGGLNGLITFYTFDPQGNVCQRLDAKASVTSTDTADAFGVVYRLPSLETRDVFGFGGQWGYYHDWDSGYNLTADPTGYSGGGDRYRFVGNNPNVFADPLGLVERWQYVAGGAAIGAGVGGVAGSPTVGGSLYDSADDFGSAYGCWESGRAAGWQAAWAGVKATGNVLATALLLKALFSGAPIEPPSAYSGSKGGSTGSDPTPDFGPGVETANTEELRLTEGLLHSRGYADRLTKDMRATGTVPEGYIKYIEYADEKYVVDGHHRLAAAKRLRWTRVPVERKDFGYGSYKTPEDLFR